MTCLMFDERSAALLFHFGRVLRKRNRGRIMIGRFRNSCGLLPPVLITRYFGRKPCISPVIVLLLRWSRSENASAGHGLCP